MNKQKIFMASDHAGIELCEGLFEYLVANGYEVEKFTPKPTQRVDYPDYAKSVCEQMSASGTTFAHNEALGVLVCSSGQGMSMTANKQPHIRAALCINEDMAKFARAHNDANILCLGQKYVSLQEGIKILKIFLEEPFEGGRHANRIAKIQK